MLVEAVLLAFAVYLPVVVARLHLISFLDENEGENAAHDFSSDQVGHLMDEGVLVAGLPLRKIAGGLALLGRFGPGLVFEVFVVRILP